jgi:branched-chain amino acid transport system substrate-binding protein
MTNALLGIVTAHRYSAVHKEYGKRPNFIAVGGYDAMHLIYHALTQGGGDGNSLLAAMKGFNWESSREAISIDPDTRDIVQNEYIRRVEKVDGRLRS